MLSSSPKYGLRKFIAQPERYVARYGRFSLTARDIDILETIYRYRYVEARHVRALLPGSGQQITRRLQGLFHNGFVGRYSRRERMRLDLTPGAPLIAYGLELKGARALEQARGLRTKAERVAGPVHWRKEYTRRSEWFLEHHLMVSNFRCVLELALRGTQDAEVVTWNQSKDIWFRVTTPGAAPRRVRIAPDAYFAVRHGSAIRHFFLEADRSTEEHRRLVDKFVGYWWYLQSGEFTSDGGERSRVNVLVVTTGAARLTNMIDTLRRMPKPNRTAHGGKGWFWFGLEHDVSIDDPLRVLRPIWNAVDGSGNRTVPLLGVQGPEQVAAADQAIAS